ncbi:unnamed protein product [Fraxinus pennsylvanica]|uniref:Uncharacterized protein n=1 Tax=Fraxinus pennsylvanica TaxID=56036 RepID=A0AAD2A2H3_9LAMI|nr:unnamed protein product [Fraxinus pennsylvanica]
MASECNKSFCSDYMLLKPEEAGLVDKLLLAVEKPMAWFGSSVEQWLNLLSSNGSLSSLALNFLRGKVIYTEKTAANFMSFIGHVDNRRDENIIDASSGEVHLDIQELRASATAGTLETDELKAMRSLM